MMKIPVLKINLTAICQQSGKAGLFFKAWDEWPVSGAHFPSPLPPCMPAAPRWICILFYTFTLPGHTPAQYRCSPNAELNLLSLFSCFSKLSCLWIFIRNLLYCCHIFTPTHKSSLFYFTLRVIANIYVQSLWALKRKQCLSPHLFIQFVEEWNIIDLHQNKKTTISLQFFTHFFGITTL